MTPFNHIDRPGDFNNRDPPPQKDYPRVHAWGAIGYNFKSPLMFYEVPGNSNGAITHKVYIEQILEVEVRKWIERGNDFVLEEDGASGHSGGP